MCLDGICNMSSIIRFGLNRLFGLLSFRARGFRVQDVPCYTAEERLRQFRRAKDRRGEGRMSEAQTCF